MADYGLTNKGPNIKRLDVILDQMHSQLSDAWGVNTRQNPQSFINHLLTNIADRIAELWEFGEDVYYSQYPSSAEGENLDMAVQYGGITREQARKSYYPIHVTGDDNTELPTGTMLSTTTKPKTNLIIDEPQKITTQAFNEIELQIGTLIPNNWYSIVLNDFEVKAYASSTTTKSVLMIQLVSGINNLAAFSAGVSGLTEDEQVLWIKARDTASSNTISVSAGVEINEVTSVILFATEEYGDIVIPDGAVTEVIGTLSDKISVTNKCPYIPGREQETDTQLRQTYASKIFNRSSTMTDSIKSAILTNVETVQSCAVYENDTDVTDSSGRPPHSIEVIVDSGTESTSDGQAIAQQILNTKAAGISTFGTESYTLTGNNGEEIVVRFNRPESIDVYFQLLVTPIDSSTFVLTNEIKDTMKDIVLNYMTILTAGQAVIPQQFMTPLYDAVEGISYIDIGIGIGSSASYNARSFTPTARQRAVSTASKIVVILDE